MTRFFCSCCVILAFLLLFTGCQGAVSDPTETPAVSSSATAAPDPSPSAPASPSPTAAPTDSQTASLFQAGTWLATGAQPEQYYFFDRGEGSGRTASLEDGLGISFTYTRQGPTAVFSMGSADEVRTCTVTVQDQNTLHFLWSDGTSEVLSYVSDQSSDQFQFYTNQELCQLALDYYRTTPDADVSAPLTATAVSQEDGMVSIQLYATLNDHNSTAAWYTVDRCTGQGRNDSTGEAVDLTA